MSALRAPRARAPSARRQKIRVRTPFSAFLAFLTQNATASTRVGTFSDIFLEQLEHYLGSHARSPEVKRALPSNLVTSLLFAQTGHKPLVHGWQGGAIWGMQCFGQRFPKHETRDPRDVRNTKHGVSQNTKHETRKTQSKTVSLPPGGHKTQNTKHETRNTKHKTRNTKHETRHVGQSQNTKHGFAQNTASPRVPVFSPRNRP